MDFALGKIQSWKKYGGLGIEEYAFNKKNILT